MAERGMARCDAVVNKRGEELRELDAAEDKGSDAHAKRVEVAQECLEEAYRALASFAGTVVKKLLVQLTAAQAQKEKGVAASHQAALERAQKKLQLQMSPRDGQVTGGVPEAKIQSHEALLITLDKDFAFDRSYHR